MRIFIIILAVFVTLLLATAIVIPIIFRDDIQHGIDKVLNDNLEAKIIFEPRKFGLTLFKNFPNPTASIESFGIVGINQFEGDTLISVNNLDLTIDIFSLFSDSYKIKSINLDKPKMNVIILKNGNSNYEIVSDFQEDTLNAVSESTADFKLLIDKWNVSNGTFSYSDETMDFQLVLEGISHTGSGNISLDKYDLVTISNIEKSSVLYEGIEYLNGQSLYANAALNIDLNDYKFTFKNNEFKINEFPFSINGYLAMPGEDIDLDISFSSTNSSIKNLYSLIPGTYTSGFEDIKTEGSMSFNGFVKGKYSESSMPSYNMSLKVSDGMIEYPDLSLPIENINIDMMVESKDGIMDNTRIEVNQFYLNAGSNPIEGSLLIRNLRDFNINAVIDARLNLSELASIFPIDGYDMRGMVLIDAKADGIYDSLQNIIPTISASVILKDGYIKSKEFQKPLDKMTFNAAINSPSGAMKDFKLSIDGFSMKMENENISGSLQFSNLVDYTWDLALKGNLDLEVISRIYQIEGTNYSGLLSVDVSTKGKYSDVKAERYNNFPTTGHVKLSDFEYTSAELPRRFKVSGSSLLINPEQMTIESFDGALGKSDLLINGSIRNYLDYIFTDKAQLQGKLSLKSKNLDLNEWMSTEKNNVDVDSGSTTLEIIKIPENVDIQFQSLIDNIYYDNLHLQSAEGLLTIRDGILDLNNLSFKLLNGFVVMNGTYDTRYQDDIVFNYQLNIKSLSIPDAFRSFTTVQAFAPMAGLMNGDFSTNFRIGGLLNEDMSPVYESLNGSGLIQIGEAQLKESKLVSGIAGFMKSDFKSNQLALKDVIVKTSLENGRAYASPFDVEIGGQKANISGSIGADGTLDYYLSTEVEAGVIGQQVNQLMASLQGKDVSTVNSKIKLNFNVGGTYENPKIMLAGTTSASGKVTTIQEQAKEEVKQKATYMLDSTQQMVEQQAKDEADKLIDKGEEQLQQQLDTLKKELTKDLEKEAGKALGSELDSTTNELKKTLQNLFRKKDKDKN